MTTEKKAKRMRREIALNMVKSWQTAPKCDYQMRINAEPMMAFRKKYNDEQSAKVSFLHLVMRAAVIALKEFPYINSSYDFERHVHLFHDEINIGVAVAVGDGLLVANTRDAGHMNLTELSAAAADVISKLTSGQLEVELFTGSTFTINNMGSYKRLVHHNAIINQPELAILSMYNITEEPVVREGQIVVQKCMNLMLSADHRVIDGKMACKFLDRIAELLEHPENLV